MHNNYKIYIISSLVVLLYIAVVAIFIQNSQNKRSNLKIEVNSIQSNIIEFTDKLPLNDDMGKRIKNNSDNEYVQAYYVFDVINNNDTGIYYEISVDNSEFENMVHSNFIKLYLTDINNNPLDGFDGKAVPTYYNLKGSSSVLTAKRLYRSYLKPKEKKGFILRAWVGDAYSIDSYDKEVKFKVNVEVD